MAKSGWIKLHRKLKESEIWKGHQPFDKRSAWLDLLLRATHKPTLMLVKNQHIKLKPGQFFVSQKGLSESWNWSRHKVANFLNVLAGKNKNKANQMITKSEPIAKIGTPKRTYLGFIITIVNWELYQSGNSNKDTKRDTRRDTSGTPKGHKQEGIKNVKELQHVKSAFQPSQNSKKLQEEIDKLIELYKKTFPEHIKVYKDGAIINMSNLIELAVSRGIPLEAIGDRIQKNKTGTPWEIVTEEWMKEVKRPKTDKDIIEYQKERLGWSPYEQMMEVKRK